jgi:hypothetical protein
MVWGGMTDGSLDESLDEIRVAFRFSLSKPVWLSGAVMGLAH